MAFKMYVLVGLLLLLSSYKHVSSSKILIAPGLSYGSLMQYVAMMGQDLAKHGYEVTIMVSDIDVNDSVKITSGLKTEIYHGNNSNTHEIMTDEAFHLTLEGRIGWLDLAPSFQVITDMCKDMLQDHVFIDRLREAKFDLVVATSEASLCPPLIANYIGVPFVLVSSNRIIPVSDGYPYMIPNNPAYVPELGSGQTDKMDFFGRLYSVGYYMLRYITVNHIIFNKYGELQQRYNIRPDLSIRDIYLDAELFMFNTDLAFDFPRPTMPNVVFLGGYMTQPANPVDKELDEFIQSSGDDGIVIFSLGTYVEFTEGTHFRRFVSALSRLPQKIIAKYGNDTPPDYLKDSDQFKLLKWLPQNDLIGHPKTKAMVYHGGLHGIFEAIYHGVPVVGLPLFYDQHDNVKFIEDKGMGIAMDLRTMTEDDLYEAIKEVIHNPRYKENAERLSRIHRDRPLSSKDTFIYWIDYILRHGGKHLQSQAVHLSFFQYYLLDVMAFILIIAVAITFLVVKLCSVLVRKCGKKLSKQKSE